MIFPQIMKPEKLLLSHWTSGDKNSCYIWYVSVIQYTKTPPATFTAGVP